MILIYMGDPGRHYPSLSLVPEHGVEYDFDENPDPGRFFTPAEVAEEPHIVSNDTEGE